jgi:hypothetical protein
LIKHFKEIEQWAMKSVPDKGNRRAKTLKGQYF